MENNNLPQIRVSYQKLYFYCCSSGFIKHRIECNAGVFQADYNAIILSYGEFTKSLLKEYNRSIEKQTCNTISHEIFHWWILNELNMITCRKFDNIAKKLADYGVY